MESLAHLDPDGNSQQSVDPWRGHSPIVGTVLRCLYHEHKARPKKERCCGWRLEPRPPRGWPSQLAQWLEPVAGALGVEGLTVRP